jgi:DNA processing protein
MHTFELEHPRYTLTSTVPLEGFPRIAIVGSRRRVDVTACAYASKLADAVVRRGGIVLSGGALGIDGCAHRGALEANGRTWVIAPTGCNKLFPPEHKKLFKDVANSAGAMVWPFPPDDEASIPRYHERNRVLVALADAIVVVQATTEHSGTFSTAREAIKAKKPLWIVPPPPWWEHADGSRVLLRRLDARILWREKDLFASVGLQKPSKTPVRADLVEQAVLTALVEPLHRDHLAERAGLKIPEMAAALFNLQIEGLIRETPDGRFERT